jgi:hypothetical protein
MMSSSDLNIVQVTAGLQDFVSVDTKSDEYYNSKSNLMILSERF